MLPRSMMEFITVTTIMLSLIFLVNLSPTREEMTAFVDSGTADVKLDSLWSDFRQKYNRTYEESEIYPRRLIWEENMKFIKKHNEEADMGIHTFRLGENQFTDMTFTEFNDVMTMKTPDSSTSSFDVDDDIIDDEDDQTHPRHLDWRKLGWVTEVKNQGACSATWAFAATGALEGQYKNKTGELVSLSEQNLIDCAAKHYHNYGCFSGSPSNAFKYVEENQGIDIESCYTYAAKKRQCEFKPWCKDALDITYSFVRPMTTRSLKDALVKVGPVAVSLNVPMHTQHFQHYKRGIYIDRRCKKRNPNHSLLVVGYGKEFGRKYWILKNSYGKLWGENGYMRMAMKGNMCGILRYATYPVAM